VTTVSFAALLVFVAIAMSGAMTLAYAVERRTGNSGWIDVVWTFGLGATGIAAALLPFGAGPAERRALVAAMVAAWAMRLGLHIAQRTAGIKDDPRYARLRDGWGADAGRQMFRLLQMQALASIPLGLGIALAAHRPASGLDWQDAAGVAVFLIGIVGGGIADRQLRTFAADPANRGHICDVGLWRYSRHPNYFFECVLWASYAAIALSSGGYAIGFVALIAPLAMTVLLTRISGIPPLEAHMLRKHGAAYAAYQARTSVLVPLPPRNAAA
jgi:steroid 5-alpha reductase family enzyme